MFKIFSQTDNKTIPASTNDTILDATLKADINHMYVCGGKARCSTCRVHIEEGLSDCQPKNEEEKHLAEKLGFPPNIRLACQTRLNGNITIRRPVVDDLDLKIISNQFNDVTGTKLGQEKKLAILFTDIVNYTQFAEAFPAYDVVHVLNRYYRIMNEIIEENNGLISDIAGDGILALFGVMELSKNSVADALNTTRAMSAALLEFNQYLQQMYNCTFGIRAGINYGEAIVGNFDTGMMKKVAAIGDSINMASRIETANKEFGTNLLLSQSAYEKVKGMVEASKMYRAKLKGKSGEYNLYEIKI